ncbi:hypothetical protein H4R33_001692 [Dimargaris cristalligena]|uniref:PapD-like protein n=1 Tax=Dimargaris cristalligena TaxID=215637 RepID=A0A4Q0A2K4_9FUNG|nr:hypothetical protein H4R33_001692 [Dimargaris cristalligena]RKP40297.1 PapD-like protein [Dimargaris cristalligena]|eukprot:RKP40297.1 PapD-like protein [Dimargaris cristalligena]
MSNSSGTLIRVTPSELHFGSATDSAGGYVGRLIIKNMRSNSVGFKFKTNAPEKFSVKPVLGSLTEIGQTVEITVRSLQPISPDDRFLIQTIHLSPEEARSLSSSMWRTFSSQRIREGFINCRLATASPSNSPSLSPSRQVVSKTTMTMKTTHTQMRSSQRSFSWKSVLEIPYMTVQLVIYLIYHLFRRMFKLYSELANKGWPRRNLLLVAVVCLLVVIALPLRKLVYITVRPANINFDSPEISPLSA